MHHKRLYESVLGNTPTERLRAIRERIRYISTEKPEYEQAIRFRNFRPVKQRLAAVLFPSALYTVRLLNREWPCNTWNRKEGTIFSHR